jgi:hypothetical protein
VFEFSLSNPSAVDTLYLTFTNGTAGSADYTTTSQTVTVPAGATTGTVSVPTTADTIAESMRPLLLPLERLRLLEQSMIMMRLNCSNHSPASATEGSPAVFEFSEQPFCCGYNYTFTFTNGTAGSADYYHFKK